MSGTAGIPAPSGRGGRQGSERARAARAPVPWAPLPWAAERPARTAECAQRPPEASERCGSADDRAGCVTAVGGTAGNRDHGDRDGPEHAARRNTAARLEPDQEPGRAARSGRRGRVRRPGRGGPGRGHHRHDARGRPDGLRGDDGGRSRAHSRADLGADVHGRSRLAGRTHRVRRGTADWSSWTRRSSAPASPPRRASSPCSPPGRTRPARVSVSASGRSSTRSGARPCGRTRWARPPGSSWSPTAGSRR